VTANPNQSDLPRRSVAKAGIITLLEKEEGVAK
jgi:hypothetical protein